MRTEKDQRREARGPIDFRASLVFLWSLNRCLHFPSSLPPPPSSPFVPLCQVVDVLRARRGGEGERGVGTGGGAGGDCSCR